MPFLPDLTSPLFSVFGIAGIKPWLDERTQHKINVVRGSYEPVLQNVIAFEQLPSEYGGGIPAPKTESPVSAHTTTTFNEPFSEFGATDEDGRSESDMASIASASTEFFDFPDEYYEDDDVNEEDIHLQFSNVEALKQSGGRAVRPRGDSDWPEEKGEDKVSHLRGDGVYVTAVHFSPVNLQPSPFTLQP
jgi:hypothetical protein